MSRKNLMLRIIIALLATFAIYWFAFRTDPKVAALNQAIEQQASPALKAYPYKFRVLSLKHGVAEMSTPRSEAMPVTLMIGTIDPSLAGKDQTDPDFVAAEKQIGALQAEARQIVVSQPGVKQVTWKLDEDWLSEHNISTP
ncbi:MAG: hypothetical protein M0Z83_00055 [Betaproteobacteria bacterium]|nr:hypothetical protein [Betaproteobacteria bacterium]